ncbi:hypothetical protein DAPPUDRAFT_315362 [Daphnia pulex]|uniref:Uncharacterized protein n=1 Tax=Daphnia pulex TaxID=6669 RepID=E9G9I9_DAPPU|nr:hypothetical protein DAPPUDRAFT_315362 [Daphnia pulex]|eukprot:EFX83574.1 hypothetical protein DAPPUDRAFT_315362 [Daphnia pulex]
MTSYMKSGSYVQIFGDDVMEENGGVPSDDAVLEITHQMPPKTNKLIFWDNWEPKIRAFEQFGHEITGYHDQFTIDNVSSTKYPNKPMAALVNRIDVTEVVFDILIHKGMEKFLGFVNAVSIHQFKKSDILAANGVVFLDQLKNVTIL